MASTDPNQPGNRKASGRRAAPKLPLSLFTPPNSSAAGHFPLAPSPSAVHPESVIDGQVVLKAGADLAKWKDEVEEVLSGRLKGIVIAVQTEAGSEEKAAHEAISL